MHTTLLESAILLVFCLSPIGVLRAEPGEASVTARVMQAADRNKDGFLKKPEFFTHATQKLQALDGSDPNGKSPKK